MDELNKVETVARFRGTEMEVVRYLADVMVSPGRGVQALNDDLDFAFLLLRQMEQGFDHDHEASPLGTAYKQPGNLSQSDACVAQQRYSDLARWFMALAQKAEEIAHAICVINARGAQDPLFQTQRPPSTTQDTYPLRSTSAHHETRASGALSQENPNRLRAGAPSYIPLSSQVLISNHNLSCSRSLERADTASHGKMEQDGGAVGQQSQPSPALSLSPTSRSKGRTSSSLKRLASAKIAAIEQAVDGSATGRPPSPDAATSAFVPATGSRQKARTSSSLERLATAKIAAVERSSNAVHYPNDTQAPIINALQVPQMTPTPTLSNYSQPSSTGVIQSSLSNSPGSSPRGRTRGFAGRTMANVIYQDTTISQSEMPTCYLRWTNFNHGKPSFLPFSTVRNATVRIAHGIHNVCITSLLDTRDSNGDIFLKFNKLSEAENYAEYVKSYPELLGPQSSIVSVSEDDYLDAEKVATARWPDRRPAMEAFGGVGPAVPAAPTIAFTAPSPPQYSSSESSQSMGGSTLVTPSRSPSVHGSDIPDRLGSPFSQKETAAGDEHAPGEGTDAENSSAVSRPRGCRGGVRVRKRKENKRLRDEQAQAQEKHNNDLRQRLREGFIQEREIRNNELRLWGLKL